MRGHLPFSLPLMKTLVDFRVVGALYLNGTGVEAQVSDQVTLFLDTEAQPGFPESIVGTIQHPITKVECNTKTSYSIEYDEADLDGAASFLRAQDVIDATVTNGIATVADELDAEIARALAAETLLAPKASPTFTGTVTLPSTTSIGTVSAVELGYLDGVTSLIQTQLNAKAALLLTHTPQSLSGAGAVNVTALSTELTSTGGAQALTLADGTAGQIKTIVHGVDGGSMVLTPTTKTGYTTITFTNAGESATLQFFTTRGWIILALNGAVAA